MMRPYQNISRFRDNLNHVAKSNRPLATALETTKPSSRLVMTANGGFNVDLGGGTLLYPDDARSACERQVAQYLQEPLRLFNPPIAVFSDCIELNRHISAMSERMASAPKAAAQAPFGGYLIVFGIGLGDHVRLLAERLDFKALIVIEPHDELIAHSFHVVDWKRLMQSLSSQGRNLWFVRGGEGEMFSQLIIMLRGKHYPYVDGSYLYTHYQAEEFTTLVRRLTHERDLTVVEGWLEDQLTMQRNNTINFSRPGFHLQRSRVASRRVMPAFVVGAGPSLDNTIEDIRRCRKDVVLISASSALKVLLEHGIRPDIHCEIENSAELADVSASLAKKHDGLSDITLYGSATIDPGISTFYKTSVYFFRLGLSSTSLYGKGAESSLSSAPTSGNTALHCALSLGFREIYLFGLDFGSRDPEYHHSRHSVYFTYEDEAEMATYTPYDFDTTVPGNFGGQVKSGWVLNWGRKSVTDAIREAGNARVMNCSDGALIPLTTPVVAEAVSIAPSSIDQSQDIADAISELPFISESLFLPKDVEQLRAAFHQFLGECLTILATPPTAGWPPQRAMVALCDQVIAKLDALTERQQAVYDTLIGHVEAMLAGAYHYASVLPPEGAGDDFARIIQGLSEGFQRLKILIDAQFDHLLGCGA
jgi:hypothetical protein